MISGTFYFLFTLILFDYDAGLCDFCKINNEKRLKNDVLVFEYNKKDSFI